MSNNDTRYKRNQEELYVKGAREHNLKNIEVRIPATV